MPFEKGQAPRPPKRPKGTQGRARAQALAAGSDPDPDRATRVAKRTAEAKPLYRAAYRKVAAGQASPIQAIRANCLDCVGWERAEVTMCTATACPLWCYRPYKDD